MSAEDVTPGTVSPRDGLVEQLRQLEAFVAHAESAGDGMPAEAVEMLARLKEIVHALDGLTSSLGERVASTVAQRGGASAPDPS